MCLIMVNAALSMISKCVTGQGLGAACAGKKAVHQRAALTTPRNAALLLVDWSQRFSGQLHGNAGLETSGHEI